MSNLPFPLIVIEGEPYDRGHQYGSRCREMITQVIGPETVLSAVGQGALAIQIRTDDEQTASLIAPLNHEETELAVRAERAFLKKLQGGCQVPIGALAVIREGQIELDGCVASLDGTKFFRGIEIGSTDNPEALGKRLADELVEQHSTIGHCPGLFSHCFACDQIGCFIPQRQEFGWFQADDGSAGCGKGVEYFHCFGNPFAGAAEQSLTDFRPS